MLRQERRSASVTTYAFCACRPGMCRKVRRRRCSYLQDLSWPRPKGICGQSSKAIIAFRSQGRGPPRWSSTMPRSSPTRNSRQPAIHRPTCSCKRATTVCRLSYASPPAGDATLRLLWSCDQFEPELVPAAALFHDGSDPELLAARQQRAGRDLFASHRCTNCHALPSKTTADAMPELSADAPRLSDAGSRLRPAWVEAWLLDPQSVCDDATMPRCLDDRPELTSREQAADIAAYLATLGKPAEATRPKQLEPNDERVAEGEALFDDLGCVQCHRFTPPAEKDAVRSDVAIFYGGQVSAGRIAGVSCPSACRLCLVAYARLPSQRKRSRARWPQLIREQGDRKNCGGGGPECNAVRGRELFQTQRLWAVSPRGRGGRPSSAEACRISGSREAVGGCLADNPAARGEAPDFGWSDDDRQSLRAFLRMGAGNLLARCAGRGFGAADFAASLYGLSRPRRTIESHGRDPRSRRHAGIAARAIAGL